MNPLSAAHRGVAQLFGRNSQPKEAGTSREEAILADGTLVLVGNYKGYREDIPDGLMHEDKGCVFRNGTQITILGPEFRDALDLLTQSPKREDFLWKLGNGQGAKDTLEELTFDGFVLDTSSREKAVHVLRRTYLVGDLKQVSKRGNRYDKVLVSNGDATVEVRQLTVDIAQRSRPDQDILTTADTVVIGDRPKVLKTLVEDLAVLRRRNVAHLEPLPDLKAAGASFRTKKEAKDHLVPEALPLSKREARRLKKQQRRDEGSDWFWYDLTDLIGSIGDGVIDGIGDLATMNRSRGNSSRPSGDTWTPRGGNGSSNYSTGGRTPSGGGGGGNSLGGGDTRVGDGGGGGFWSGLFDGFDLGDLF